MSKRTIIILSDSYPTCGTLRILRSVITFGLYIMGINLCAQNCNLILGSPIKHKTVLSGSYGEPRTRHFHSGIDYKQYRGIPRDTIYAVADGYLSRISIQAGGYGNALYINHQCDKTSVYAHLYDFSPKIRGYINEVLSEKQRYSIVHHLEKDSIPISKGDYIGIMGSTGRSSGPHLHFEIRKTSSDVPINPALVGLKPLDDIAPKIVGIMLYELTPDNQELSKSFHPAILSGINQYRLPENEITTSALKLGVGIRTYDQMNGASNHNGIYSLELSVDGERSFSFALDSIPFDLSKFIHAHMDYQEKIKNKYVTKCFLNPANQLPIYNSDRTGGTIHPFEFRATNVEVVVRDIEGNTANITFDIRRESSLRLSTPDQSHTIRISPSDSITLDFDSSTVTFDKGTFSQPIVLERPHSTSSSIFLKQEEEIPTFRSFKVTHRIGQNRYPKHQYTFTRANDKKEIERYRARWTNDTTLVTFVSALDRYDISIDSIEPTIRVISIPGPTRRRCKFEVRDNFVSVHDVDALSLKVYLDNQWTLCQVDAKNNSIWFDMPIEVTTPKTHSVKIVAIDAAKNRAELTRTFIR